MKHFVIMGVSGCGKSTIARLLTDRVSALGVKAAMIEADELHGEANVEKMRRGDALTDEDRLPWLIRVSDVMKSSPETVFVSCSALRRQYRQCLVDHLELPIGFIHLHADREVILNRMANRKDHFMPVSLLDSQIKTLEPLEDDEFGVVIDIAKTIDQVVNDALAYVLLNVK